MPATGKTGVSGIWCQQPKSDGGGGAGAPGPWCKDLEQVRVLGSATGMGLWLTSMCAWGDGMSLS